MAPERLRFSVRAGVALLGGLALAGCAAGPRNGDRAGRDVPLRGSPSAIVAAEFAFLRAAQDDGQWTAFADFAADDAQMLGTQGLFAAKPWLKQQANPAETVSWRPHAVWVSCDGTLAVSRGGYRYPAGDVGTFYTVWQRQRRTEYKWVLDFGIPAAQAPEEPIAVEGQVADCPHRGAAPPTLPGGAGSNLRRSDDHTLAVSIDAAGEPSARSFTVWQAKGGAMVPVIEQTGLGS